MITLTQAADINWINLYRVAYQDEPLAIDAELLRVVDAGHAHFVELIERGLPSYGVTTGLGKLVTTELDDSARAELPANLLRARAVAIGDPFTRPVARAMMIIRLVNFLSGRATVRGDLCQYLVDRINDDFTPWVPSLGHGMAADAIANTHAFQTLIGEGFVYGPDNQRQSAALALKNRKVNSLELVEREGLALINGVCAAPALTMDSFYKLDALLGLANQIEHLALALAHVGCLSERRLHRLLSADNTGLNPQLATRPGLDAGLVVTQKASIDLAARLRLLAQPVSLHTSETSDGQEDYMSMAIPAISRLYEMAYLTRAMLAYELLAGIVAVRMRDQTPGDGVVAVLDYFDETIAPLDQDRSPAVDVETILEHFTVEAFTELSR